MSDDCLHVSTDISGFVLGGGTHCVSWGTCELCGDHIMIYAVDWWQIAFRMWDVSYGYTSPSSHSVLGSNP